MKSAVKIVLIIIAIPLVGLIFRYGTLAPCEMLKSDLRGRVVADLFEKTPSSDNPWEMMGQGFGLLMLGPMIDNFVSTLSPWECSKGLYRLNVQGEEVLPGDTAEMAQAEQAKLRSEVVEAERLYDEQAKAEEEKKEKKKEGEEEEEAEKQAYLPSLELYGFKAKYFASYTDKRIPGVEFKIKNNGDRTLRKVKVTVYFKDRDGAIIVEEDYHPVLVTEYSFGGDNKPLKPNYIWQLERGKFYQAKSVPSEWVEGQAEAQITDIEFLEK